MGGVGEVRLRVRGVRRAKGVGGGGRCWTEQREKEIAVDRRRRMKRIKVAFTLLGPTFRSRYSRSFFSCM